MKTIFRQAEDSQIITNAHRINQGQIPFFAKGEQGDFYLFPAEDAAAAADWVVDVVTDLTPTDLMGTMMELGVRLNGVSL